MIVLGAWIHGKNDHPPDLNENRALPVSILSSEILVMESFPMQVVMIVSGELPTPCHTIEWQVSEPDADHRIDIELWAVGDPEAICIQLLGTFEERIPLGDFTEYGYRIWINGERAGEF
jgi:hypothetical protein